MTMTCNMCGAEGRDPFGECLNCAEPYPYAKPHPTHACSGCGFVEDYCKCDLRMEAEDSSE